jgi:tetratricopeptide (TPR) repeat protein
MAGIDLTMAGNLLTDDRTALFSAAETNAVKALSIAPDHAVAHSILGTVYIFTNRAAQGIAECEQALALNGNLAAAHAAIGLAKCFLGRAAETEGHTLEALRLSPRDISAYRWMSVVGWAKLQLDADAEAVGWVRRSIEVNRNCSPAHFVLAAALGLLGAPDEARAAAQAGLALNPSFTIRRLRAVAQSSDNPAFLAGLKRNAVGLRLAGVPEG